MVHRSDAGNFSPESENSRRDNISAKSELAEFAGEEEERLENRDSPLTKRLRFDSSDQKLRDLLRNPIIDYNPLEEPSPLGLKLKKTPSFLDLIQMKLCQERSSPLAMSLPRREKGQRKGAGPAADRKLKASNFFATLIRIGTWEYKSVNEGDLVVKCYFAKHKLVWEVLDGGLKNKIEIRWSDIMSIKATYCGDGPETLDVVVGARPLFFRELDPQPRKHTLWEGSTDFTGGQALTYRRHVLQFAKGTLEKHFQKLIQCDPRFNHLSQQPEIVLEDPFFPPPIFAGVDKLEKSFDLKREDRCNLFDLQSAASSSGCSKFGFVDPVAAQPTLNDLDSEGTSPPALAADSGFPEQEEETFEGLEILDQIKLPRIHHSMSKTDLAGHIGQCISEQVTSGNDGLQLDEEEKKSILEDIAECLLSDSQVLPVSDEKSLISRVNSLCSFLQKEVPSHTDSQTLSEESKPSSNGESEASGMSRKDSAGELLLDLPRIASLPHFLNDIGEDED